MKSKASRRAPRPPHPAFPLYCDFSCPHASFAHEQSVGACRREQGVYCAFFRTLNNKHSLCLDRKKKRSPQQQPPQ